MHTNLMSQLNQYFLNLQRECVSLDTHTGFFVFKTLSHDVFKAFYVIGKCIDGCILQMHENNLSKIDIQSSQDGEICFNFFLKLDADIDTFNFITTGQIFMKDKILDFK